MERRACECAERLHRGGKPKAAPLRAGTVIRRANCVALSIRSRENAFRPSPREAGVPSRAMIHATGDSMPSDQDTRLVIDPNARLRAPESQRHRGTSRSRRQLAGLWSKACLKSLHKCAWSESPTVSAISLKEAELVSIRKQASSSRRLTM